MESKAERVRHSRRNRTRERSDIIRKRDNDTCQYCGHPAETIDHIIPLNVLVEVETRIAVGDGNTCASCILCNKNKADLTVEAFFATPYWVMIQSLGLVKEGFPKVVGTPTLDEISS